MMAASSSSSTGEHATTEAERRTIPELCEPLVESLQMGRQMDESSYSSLLRLRAQIDDALKVRDGSAVVKAKGRGQVVSLMANSADDSSISSQGRPREKRRVMVSLLSYIELTQSQSNATAMERYLGSTVYRWCWQRRAVWSRLGVFMNVINILATYLFIVLDLQESQRAGLAAILILTSTIEALRLAIVMNFWLLKRSLRTLDGAIFLAELALFALSIISLFCFRLSAVLYAVNAFLRLSSFLVYDSYPSFARKRLGTSLFWIGCAFLGSTLVLYYARVPTHMCYYRLNLVHGLMTEDEEHELKEKSRWSFSLLEFCINRGLTILALMLRIAYLATQYPADCVLIKSRVRVLELPPKA